MTPDQICSFWREAGPRSWFAKDEDFDAACRDYEAAHHAAARGELDSWAETAEGALALILLLDQFPRNLYRGSAHAFATDALARRFADQAVVRGFDQDFPPDLRAFFYLPFEHSEAAADQARSLALFEALGDENYFKFAKLHADIITRFGRFPHRNACLGRETSAAESAFLAEGGFSG